MAAAIGPDAGVPRGRRGGVVPIEEARTKLNRGQLPFLDRLSGVADEG